MNANDLSSVLSRSGRRLFCLLVVLLSLFLLFEPLLATTISAKREQRRGNRHTNSKIAEQQRIAHVLARLGFGARPGDLECVKAIGIKTYIEQQLNPESIDDRMLDEKIAKLSTLALATPVLLERYNPLKPVTTPVQATSSTGIEAAKPNNTAKPEARKPAPDPQHVITELQRAAFLRAVYSDRQLYEVVVDFWENHFNVFINKDADRFLLTSFDRDAIRPFAMGRFRDLLGATAHSPAMLFYLDNWESSAPHTYPAANGKPARTTGGINENYARELMELHTLGVDGGYTQKDVQEVARCFTGWTIRKPNEEGLFFFNPAMHDNGEKTVLGNRIAAGGGISDGERVLDILARHPSTARFIATKLARRFIGDDPPPKVINRAAAVFLKTDGSIRETLRAIITSPEFFSSDTYRSKVKSPFEYAVSAVRALAAETDGDRPMLDWIARMGEPIFGKLTPNGYADRGEEWLSSSTFLERLNFSIALVTNKIKGTRFDSKPLLAGMGADDNHSIVISLIKLLLDGNVGPKTREALEKAADASLPAQAKEPVSLSLIALVIGAPEFQRR